MSNQHNYQLATEDVAVILTGLRLLQRTPGDQFPSELQEIVGDSLDVVNIDKLCESLNLDGVDAEQPSDDEILLQRVRAELSRDDWDAETPQNLFHALVEAGYAPFQTDQEGWFLDVVNNAYAVVADEHGPYRNDAQAIAAIARRFADGSQWHGEVLDIIGLAACENVPPRLTIAGRGPNDDVIVASTADPDARLEVGYRPKWGVLSVYLRRPESDLVTWLKDAITPQEALRFCAGWLRCGWNERRASDRQLVNDINRLTQRLPF